jgi:hypothetical protein
MASTDINDYRLIAKKKHDIELERQENLKKQEEIKKKDFNKMLLSVKNDLLKDLNEAINYIDKCNFKIDDISSVKYELIIDNITSHYDFYKETGDLKSIVDKILRIIDKMNDRFVNYKLDFLSIQQISKYMKEITNALHIDLSIEEMNTEDDEKIARELQKQYGNIQENNLLKFSDISDDEIFARELQKQFNEIDNIDNFDKFR